MAYDHGACINVIDTNYLLRSAQDFLTTACPAKGGELHEFSRINNASLRMRD